MTIRLFFPFSTWLLDCQKPSTRHTAKEPLFLTYGESGFFLYIELCGSTDQKSGLLPDMVVSSLQIRENTG